MERCVIITYKGKSIIYSDLTNFNPQSKEELREAINQVKAKIAKYPSSSVRLLTDVTGLRFDTEIINIFKEYMDGTYVKNSAVIGITGMKQFVLNCLLRTAVSDTHSFNTKDEALEWLVR